MSDHLSDGITDIVNKLPSMPKHEKTPAASSNAPRTVENKDGKTITLGEKKR